MRLASRFRARDDEVDRLVLSHDRVTATVKPADALLRTHAWEQAF